MNTPAITWAMCLEMGGTPPSWKPAVSTAEAAAAPMSIPAGTRFR